MYCRDIYSHHWPNKLSNRIRYSYISLQEWLLSRSLLIAKILGLYSSSMNHEWVSLSSFVHTFFVFSNRGLVISPSVICCPVVLQVNVCYRALDTIDVRFSSLNIRGEYKPEHFGKEKNGWSQAWPGVPDTRVWHFACGYWGGAPHLPLWILQGKIVEFYSSLSSSDCLR